MSLDSSTIDRGPDQRRCAGATSSVEDRAPAGADRPPSRSCDTLSPVVDRPAPCCPPVRDGGRSRSERIDGAQVKPSGNRPVWRTRHACSWLDAPEQVGFPLPRRLATRQREADLNWRSAKQEHAGLQSGRAQRLPERDLARPMSTIHLARQTAHACRSPPATDKAQLRAKALRLPAGAGADRTPNRSYRRLVTTSRVTAVRLTRRHGGPLPRPLGNRPTAIDELQDPSAPGSSRRSKTAAGPAKTFVRPAMIPALAGHLEALIRDGGSTEPPRASSDRTLAS